MRRHAKASSAGPNSGSGRRRHAVAGLSSLAILLVLASIPAIASAAKVHPPLGIFGGANPPSLGQPQDLSVDQATGDLLVVDRTAATVSRWHADGTPAPFSALNTNEIDGAGFKKCPTSPSDCDETPENNLSIGGAGEMQVTVDDSGGETDGNIYVTQVSRHLIDVFASDGHYLGQLTESSSGPFGEACGVAVDSSGAVYVGDYSEGKVHKFVPSGSLPVKSDNVANFSSPSPCTLTAGASSTAGALFVARYGGEVSKLDSTSGALLYTAADGSNVTATVDPATGRLYGARGQQGEVKEEIREYDASGSSEATLLSRLPISSAPTGIAVGQANGIGTLYLSRAGSSKIEMFGAAAVTLPSAITAEASQVTPGNATLNGEVNPNGVAVTGCYFEYGLTAAYGTTASCDKSAAEIGGGEGPVDVAADLSGLQPGIYHFRLVATNANAGGTARGEDKSFGVPGPPGVAEESVNPGETDADLRARISPSNAETSYHFEFGPSASYGQSTPAKTVAAGPDAVDVTAHISGLTPGQTYHFRAVASNEVDTAEGADQAFTTEVASAPSTCPDATESSPGFRSYLPQCRAYEFVSPPFSGGPPLFGVFGVDGLNVTPVSPDGTRVLAASLGTFANQESGSNLIDGNLGTVYLLTRTGSGWKADGLNDSAANFAYQVMRDATPSLDKTLWSFSPDLYPRGSNTYYLRDDDGHFRPIGPDTYENRFVGRSERPYLGASADFSRIVLGLYPGFEERLGRWPGDTTAPGRSSLYEYGSEGGTEPKLIGVKNEGPLESNAEAQPISECGTELGSPNHPETGEVNGGDIYNAISPSGFAVFFTASPGPCAEGTGNGPPVAELYARVEGAHTIAISEPSLSVPGRECTSVCRESQNEENGHVRQMGRFLGASSDGHKAYFLTSQPLIDSDTDEGPDLYLAELGPTSVTGLVDVSEGQSEAPTPGEGADVQGVARVSEDGSRIYFVAQGVLSTEANGNGESAAAGVNNLYLYEPSSGRTAFVTRLASTDAEVWGFRNGRPAQPSAPDGRFLVFSSNAHPQGTGDFSATSQLFRYDAQNGDLVRVSVGQRGTYVCPQSGELEVGYNCNGNVQSGDLAPRLREQDYSFADRAVRPTMGVSITPEGSVFFESRAALTPAAKNGFPNGVGLGLRNVYEYHDGQTYLISDGTEEPFGFEGGEPISSTFFVGADGDGSDVILLTSDQLVPQDSDTVSGLYDARINGGIPVPAGIECAGEGCQGPASVAEAGQSPASATLRSSGNVKSGRGGCAKGRRRQSGKCVKKKHGPAHKKKDKRTKTNRRASR